MIKYEIFAGDNMARLQALPDDSIDSVVTDPPYGLSGQPDMAEIMRHWLAGDDYSHRGGGFMGRAWDQFSPGPATWREVFRVLKPGGHLIAFGGTRTYDLLTLAIRLAGFEVRDQIGWLYGSGMPHGQNIGKAIDAAAGAEREVVGTYTSPTGAKMSGIKKRVNTYGEYNLPRDVPLTEPATEAARQWDGWHSALKPAWEPVLVARKPISESTLIKNVIAHGTGALNIDACRVDTGGETIQTRGRSDALHERSDSLGDGWSGDIDTTPRGARFPPNVIHDGSDEVLAEFAKYGRAGGGYLVRWSDETSKMYGNGRGLNRPNTGQTVGYGDSGTAARFFYSAKAAKGERNAGCEALFWKRDPDQVHGYTLIDQGQWETLTRDERAHGNIHATVKPVALMAWLIRLVTPPGGVVLDPFMGSGTTGVAAVAEGMGFVGMDLEPTIAQARIFHALTNTRKGPQKAAKRAAAAQDDKQPTQVNNGGHGAKTPARPMQLSIFGSD